MLFAFGGYWLYFTPTADISVDINPSIELGINRFDKVVSVSSYNDDGQELLDSINIKYMDYTEAVDQILANENIAALLDNDAVMTITVVGSDGSQSARLLSGVESCTEGQKIPTATAQIQTRFRRLIKWGFHMESTEPI